MAVIHKTDDEINGYRVIEHLNTGQFAISYTATNRDRVPLLLKQYKSPSIKVDWYGDYVHYQHTIDETLIKSAARNVVVKMIDAFEFRFCYYQVFEFIEGGLNLKKVLSTRAENAASYSWEQMLNFAKVMMTSINAFHNTGIIHCDLKPDNIFLIHDPEIKVQYRLKLIDIDFSILSDVAAPWHGKMGYVGTENYLSPEHLLGKTPQKASDIFTCGIMLYELLSTKGYPYMVDNPDEYRRKALTHDVEPPVLPINFCGDRKAHDNITALIHQALNHQIKSRPSAEAILGALNTIVPVVAEPRSLGIPKKKDDGTSIKPPVTVPEKPASSTEPSKAAQVLELRHESGKDLRFSINTNVGKSLYKSFGQDSQFVDSHQFTVKKDVPGKWSLIPNPDATNETLLNGKAVRTATALKNGDTICIGREAKNIKKLPLTVSLK